jgi:hypothetical protein
MRIIVGLLACAAMMILAAFAGAQSSSPETVSVTSRSAEPTTPPGLQEYQTIQELADDLTRHGHTCDVTPMGWVNHNVTRGKCTVDGIVVLLSLFTSQSEIDAQLAEFESLFEAIGLDFGFLVGKNWTINCRSRTPCEKLHEDLGGSVVAALPVTANG